MKTQSRKRSPLWNFFTETEGKRAKCGFCSAVLSYKGGSTTNFLRHVISKHPGVVDHSSESALHHPLSEVAEERPSTTSSCDELAGSDDKSLFLWRDASIKLLIEAYEKEVPNFNSTRIRKKQVWENIADEMTKNGYSIAGIQCENKWKRLLYMYQEIKNKNMRRRRTKNTWYYYTLMDNILGDQLNVDQSTTDRDDGDLGATSDCSQVNSSQVEESSEFSTAKSQDDACLLESNTNTQETQPNKPKSAKLKCLADRYLLLQENREIAKERRHKEIMEVMMKNNELIERLLSVIENKD